MGEEEEVSQAGETAVTDWVEAKSKKEKETDEVGPDKDAWMVTFSDLLQLLITFFVLLISMSSMDDKAVKEMFNVFSGATGALNLTEKARDFSKDLAEDFMPKKIGWDELKEILAYNQEIQEARKLLEREAYKNLVAVVTGGVEVVRKGKNVSLSLSEDALFERGEVEIKDALKPLLDRVARILSLSRNHVIIEGHTDNLPVRGKYLHSNWEVSAARASSVLKYLMSTGLIENDRMEANGYAFYKPRVKNLKDTYRKRNRRIEIVIKQMEKDSF
jgi:chemotaxis protein MotB